MLMNSFYKNIYSKVKQQITVNRNILVKYDKTYKHGISLSDFPRLVR